MDWLVRQGLESDSMRVVGLDEVLEKLREEMRWRYRQFNLDKSLDEIRDKLGNAVDLEQAALAEQGDSEEVRPKRDLLDSLPYSMSEAMERLEKYGFTDRDVERDVQDLLEELENIRDLEEFCRRYGDLFHRKEALGYEQAVELMREMERLKKLEEELFAGNLQGLRPDELGELLGKQTAQDVHTLQRIMKMISDSAYVKDEDGRFRLSPKGVRKIGQLALRDIYQKLLHDRSGSHVTDHRGQAEIRPRTDALLSPMATQCTSTSPGRLRKALLRKPGVPLAIEPGDFEIFETDSSTTTSTVLLLDMSYSMSWEGRFAAAKKVAMALESLLRTPLSTRLLRNRRFLHEGGRAQAERPSRGLVEHGGSVHQPAGWLAARGESPGAPSKP